MNCKKGDTARIVAPAPMELRGNIVICVSPATTGLNGRAVPAWVLDRRISYPCGNCGKLHTWDIFPDACLRPLPKVDDKPVVEEVEACV